MISIHIGKLFLFLHYEHIHSMDVIPTESIRISNDVASTQIETQLLGNNIEYETGHYSNMVPNAL